MPIIDLHAHLGPCPWPVPSEDPVRLVEKLDLVAIDLCVAHPPVAEGGQLLQRNSALAATIEGHERLAGCVWLDAAYVDESVEVIAALMPRKNFRAAAMELDATDRHPMSANVEAIIKALLRYTCPIIVHRDERTPIAAVVQLAEKFAKVPMLLTEFGGRGWREVLRAIERRTNLYISTGSHQPQRDLLKTAVGVVGQNRVVYGSNLPFTDPLVALGMIRDSDISAVAKDRILHRNARRLLNLETA